MGKAPKATTFSSRSNAKRAAEKEIATGTAPSIDYGLHTHEDGRFEIVWKTGTMPAEEHFDSWECETEEDKIETEIEEAAADTSVNASDGEQNMPDRFPPGTRVIVQVGKRKRSVGLVDYRVDATSCRVKMDDPFPSILCRYSQLSLDDGSEPLPPTVKPFGHVKPERKPRAAPSGDRKPSKSAELDAAAARGEMPAKPIMTSKANQLQYQKRFDLLEKAALAGNWDAVRGYEVKGINSYAKMVKQYRDRLLAAHAASTSADKAA